MVYLVLIFIIALAYYLLMSPTSQVLGHFPYRVKTAEKLVALSFDDGPNSPYTEQLLDVLQRHNVPVTFFLVGKNLQKYPQIGKRMLTEGHIVGNHAYSHEFHKYFTSLTFRTEVETTQEIIRTILGRTPALFRPPWLFRHPGIFKSLRQNKLTAVSGLFGSELEVLQPQAQSIAHRALSKVKPGTILIFHDGFDARGGNRAQTVYAVDLLITELKAQGYSFITVDKLLGIQPYQ